ncbi:MAG: T9SS type A sorting domain-containing protein [Fimbriimonadaceae bacterium]|nr:T9SS type A sorting domain-containing protein [Chitinophagales bacterium]
MNRKKFLSGLGLAGLTSIIPFSRTKASEGKMKLKAALGGADCVLIPHETAGPYPLDLSGDETFFRTDITEGKEGIPLDLTIKIVSIQDDCAPIANARFDLWHNDRDGWYSGFVQPGIDTTGETFCRGIQITDVNGEVKFNTIYPGWYPGRTTHTHFQIFLSSVLSATSQMAFPDAINTIVYDDPLYPKGQNTTVETTADDGVFAGGYEDQLLTITPNLTTGGYDGSLTIGLDEPATVGLINLEPETGGQFKLMANYPNPFITETVIPFTLNYAADVKIEIYDLMGKKIAEVCNGKFQKGEHKIIVKRKIGDLVLSSGNYAYQLTTENTAGRFMQVKVMTVGH